VGGLSAPEGKATMWKTINFPNGDQYVYQDGALIVNLIVWKIPDEHEGDWCASFFNCRFTDVFLKEHLSLDEAKKVCEELLKV